MKAALKAVNELEKDHMQKMAELIYDPDGKNTVTVKDVKEMLKSAAKATASVKQAFEDANALVQKFKRLQEKKGKEKEAAQP